LLLNSLSTSVFAALHPAASPATAEPVAGAVSLPELLRHFLSDDERRILRVLASVGPEQHPSESWVQERSEVEKSAFWVIWRGLQLRGLVREEGSGKRRWYVLALPWLPLLLS
jgi:hypothetical protein